MGNHPNRNNAHKMHRIKVALGGGSEIKTYCGKRGYRTKMTFEYDAVSGARFEATHGGSGEITCTACRRLSGMA